jgi:hypothetical protein
MTLVPNEVGMTEEELMDIFMKFKSCHWTGRECHGACLPCSVYALRLSAMY